jgi:hypothetical protein
MSSTHARVVDEGTAVDAGRSRTWPVLVLAIGCAAAYAVFFVLPYYANDLQRFPLADVAVGYHDPKDLWPRTTAWGPLFAFGGFVTLTFGPFMVVGTLGWAVAKLVAGHATRWRGRAILLVAIAVSLATLVWLGTPFAGALMGWFLD